MSAGAGFRGGCSQCGGYHSDRACLTWITAHDEGSVPACPQRHIHCARCEKGLIITLKHLQDSSPAGVVQTFIRRHALCLPKRR